MKDENKHSGFKSDSAIGKFVTKIKLILSLIFIIIIKMSIFLRHVLTVKLFIYYEYRLNIIVKISKYPSKETLQNYLIIIAPLITYNILI